MLPTGFKLINNSLIYYNSIIGKLQDNIITWTNERTRHFEFEMFRQQLEQFGFKVRWGI